MTAIAPPQRRWLTTYGLVLAALLGLAVLIDLRIPSYRTPPFDFNAMKAGDIFITNGLTRRQQGSVKLGFAEAFAPPQIGLYGNHIFEAYGAEALGRPEQPGYFFNYTFANLSLPEIHRYLRHVEKLGHLPTKLILVQITPPNADNGHFVINWGNELPPDVLLSDLQRESFASRALQLATLGWELLNNWLHEIVNYNTFILGLIQRNDKDRLVGPELCEGLWSNWLLHLPATLRNILGLSAGRLFYCQPDAWEGALRRDGSVGGFDNKSLSGPLPAPLTPNENLLRDAERGLNDGDEAEIARQLRAIDAVGRRHGVRVVFIVGPVYETDRHDSVVNRIFDRALALVPDIQLIDDREMHTDPSLFSTPIHPSPKYFRIVANQLRHRGFLD
jgi:hypothetical protein